MKIIAYHWSPERFEKFDNAYIGSTNSSTYLNGFYFANEPLKGTEGYLYKCELTINNPIEIDVSLSDWDSLGVQEAISALVNHGDWGYIKDYLVDNVEMDVEEAETLLEQWEQADGAILTNVSYDYHTIEYIVFDANQIKIVERTALEDEQASNVYETLNKLKENANIFSKLNEQLAFHGSRAEFEKFNSDKIKEYRFGWGFYFTRSQSYASDYGNVKQYEIPDDEYLLDWESSYNYQPETVQNALYEIWQDIKEKDTELLFEKALFGDYCNNGYWIYHTLSEVLKISAKDTSLLLNKYGIKGIYSLEGNCIVIFNPADIKMSVTEDNIFTKTINKVKNLFKGPKLNKNFWNWFGNSKVIENGKPCICYHGSYTKIDKFSNKHGNFNTVNGNDYGAFWFTSDENVAKGYSFSAVSSNTLKQLTGVSAGELDSDELENALWEFRNEIKIAIEKAEKNPELNPSFLKIENPIIVDCKEQFYAEYGSYFAELVRQNGRNKFLLSQLERLPMFKPYLNKINNNDGVIFINAKDNNDFSNTISTIYVVWNPKQIKSINNKGIWSESENVYEHLNKQLQKYLN